ncbi:MAG: cation diffusion facilitator family transporter [Bacteroidales bacterium]
MTAETINRAFLRRYAWISIAAAVATITLKAGAYLLTGSVGLLSDAVESLVNLAGALMALWMLTVAAREPDEEHAFGHSKAEYFSSGVEGALIVVAAISIAIAAVDRLLSPRPLEQIGLGLAVSVGASLINLFVSRILSTAGHRFQSVTLQAGARHLMTDVWTSAGVVVALAAVTLTGWVRLDPVIGLVVAANIVVTGFRIVRESVGGLMDIGLPVEELERVRAALDRHARDGIQFHALRSRRSGARTFVAVHVLVPGAWTVHRGHQFLEHVEADIRAVLPGVTVFTHLESLEDPASWDDQHLDRAADKSS